MAHNTPQVGDTVNYVPHECHALNRNPAGDHPWVLGRKYMVMEGGELVEKVEELHGRRVNEYLGYLQRHPDPSSERKNLVLIRPNALWPAKVVNVNDDDTVDLEVQSNNSGVTLHYKNVSLDHTKKKSHSCHQSPEQVRKESKKAKDDSQERSVAPHPTPDHKVPLGIKEGKENKDIKEHNEVHHSKTHKTKE